MSTIVAKGLHVVRARGRLYRYAWRGGPRLFTEPGTDAFLAELAQARASRVQGDKSKISGLCARYRASTSYRNLADKTRKEWARWLDRIQVQFGAAPLAAFDSPKAVSRITDWRDQYAETPRTADVAIEVMSRLLSFGRAQGLLTGKPCESIDRLYTANRSALIWTDADFAELEKTASAELVQAAKLAALTGLRRADLLRLSWSHIGPLAIEISTGKSRHRKTTRIPIYGELRSLLDDLPRKATTVLTNSAGRPWASGFGASWNKAKPAGPLHFHDLRGTAATRFFLAGLTIREIADIMTWSEGRVEGLIDRYVKRDELLLSLIRRLDGNAPETGNDKTPVKRGHPGARPKPQRGHTA